MGTFDNHTEYWSHNLIYILRWLQSVGCLMYFLYITAINSGSSIFRNVHGLNIYERPILRFVYENNL